MTVSRQISGRGEGPTLRCRLGLAGGVVAAFFAIFALVTGAGVRRHEGMSGASRPPGEAVGLHEKKVLPNQARQTTANQSVVNESAAKGRLLQPTTLNPWPVLVSSKNVDTWERFERLTDHGAKVAYKTAHDKFLTVQADGTVTGDGVKVMAWQTFHELYHPTDGTVSIESWQGKYLTAFPNGDFQAKAESVGPWERFKLEAHADGTVALLSTAHNRYVSAVKFKDHDGDHGGMLVSGMQAEFERIYKHNFWQYGSGYGSLPQNTVGYRAFLQKFLKEHNIKSVVDVGCGDWQFSRLMDWTGISYLGVDIAEIIIEQDKKRFENPPGIRFKVGSATEAQPEADLLIIREVLQHLPFVAIRKFLRVNALSGRYKYALMTNEKNHKGEVNIDARPNGQVNARGLDLSAAPFNVPDLKVVYTHLEIETVLYSRDDQEIGSRILSPSTPPQAPEEGDQIAL